MIIKTTSSDCDHGFSYGDHLQVVHSQMDCFMATIQMFERHLYIFICAVCDYASDGFLLKCIQFKETCSLISWDNSYIQ